MPLRFSTTLNIFDSVYDGYCKEGYREPIKFTEALMVISKIKKISAVELRHSDITSDLTVKTVKRMLKDYDLFCSAVSVDYSESKKYALGALGHQHPKMRSSAIDEGRKAVDIARGLGTTEVVLRLYTDGSDYPFHVDYLNQWNTIISSVKTVAKYASPDINVSVLYKPREPRKFITVSSGGRALAMCQEIAMKNIGVAISFSNSLMAGEIPAETIAQVARAGKLFQMYLNDTCLPSDDLLVPGGYHLWELLETLFYLKTAKYKGYYNLDLRSPRMEPIYALQIAIGNIEIMDKKLEKLDITELRKAQRTLDAIESQKIIRRVMFI
ncbi:MAG TPA: TIM barrel protein [Candidatus Hydrogenedens sp.]|nr:sugar phosphate isomerase/epimerase [Candidatus Hydrogenedens sp.]HOK10362.1 TIM barrel protein [Candidatus Hydrogenedens sp.]HOL20687.1 TIM barrel protein [Candidatus Hydrogenedens sp.]HPP59861.1 TIM barrel protein [Candidatus Hydrogenedens sp.]